MKDEKSCSEKVKIKSQTKRTQLVSTGGCAFQRGLTFTELATGSGEIDRLSLEALSRRESDRRCQLTYMAHLFDCRGVFISIFLNLILSPLPLFLLPFLGYEVDDDRLISTSLMQGLARERRGRGSSCIELGDDLVES